MMVVHYGFIPLVTFNKPLPAPDPPTRERFMTVVRDEIATTSRNLNEAAAQGLRHIKSR